MLVSNEKKLLYSSKRYWQSQQEQCWGSMTNKMKLCPDLYGTMLFYAAGVWGFKNAPDSNAIQNWVMRCILRVHKYTAK